MSLTVGGVSIPVQSITERPPYRDGDYRRLANGKPIDQSTIVKRVWSVRTAFMGQTEYDSVIAKLDLRTRQVIGGTLVDITAGRTTVTADGVRGGAGWERAVDFTLQEDEA